MLASCSATTRLSVCRDDEVERIRRHADAMAQRGAAGCGLFRRRRKVLTAGTGVRSAASVASGRVDRPPAIGLQLK